MGGASGAATNWTGCATSPPANLELIFQQTVQRIFIHEQEDKVGLRCADLQTDTAAGEVEKRRRAPTAFHAAADHPVTGPTADDEPGLDHARKNRNSFSFIEQFLRYCLVRDIHDFGENVGSLLRFLRRAGKLLGIL